MMDSDLLFGMALLLLATWLAYRGLRSLTRVAQTRGQEQVAMLQDKLPAIGKAGTLDKTSAGC